MPGSDKSPSVSRAQSDSSLSSQSTQLASCFREQGYRLSSLFSSPSFQRVGSVHLWELNSPSAQVRGTGSRMEQAGRELSARRGKPSGNYSSVLCCPSAHTFSGARKNPSQLSRILTSKGGVDHHCTVMNTEPLPNGIVGKALRSQSTEQVRDGLATSSLSPPHTGRPPSLGKGGEGDERKGWWGREAWGSLTDPVGAHGVTSGKRPHSSWASEYPPSIKEVRKLTVSGKETGILKCCMNSSGRERGETEE